MDALRVLARQVAGVLGDRLVRKKVVAIAEMTAAHGGVSAEFAYVGHKQRRSAIGGDGLTCLNFSGIKIEQSAVVVDAADTENLISALNQKRT